jgi:hypothetical protein
MPGSAEVPALSTMTISENASQHEGNQSARSQTLYLQLKDCLKQRRVVDYHKFGISQKTGSEVQHLIGLNRDMVRGTTLKTEAVETQCNFSIISGVDEERVALCRIGLIRQHGQGTLR